MSSILKDPLLSAHVDACSWSMATRSKFEGLGNIGGGPNNGEALYAQKRSEFSLNEGMGSIVGKG